jgi:hypothetical protein
MKLWLLRPIPHEEDANHDDDTDCPRECPWNPWYDKTYGAVVRAETAGDARRFVPVGDWEFTDSKGVNPWLDEALSWCTELTAAGEEGEVVIRDFRSA